MFCRNCGNEVIGEAKFCPHCGAEIVVMGAAAPLSETKAAAVMDANTLLEFINPLNGSTYQANVDQQKLMGLNATCKNDREYENWIDNLDGVNSTLRDIFKKLVKFTVAAGKIVFKMGKVVLDIVMKIVHEYSHTIAGVIAGFALGCLISAIPLIGWVLGPLVVPLLTVIGGVAGFMEDMSRRMNNAQVESKIRSNILKDFSAMGLNI